MSFAQIKSQTSSLIVLVNLVIRIIMGVRSLVVLIHAVIDGRWLVVGILIGGLIDNFVSFIENSEMKKMDF